MSLDIFGLPQIIDDGQHFSGSLLAFVTGSDGNTFGGSPIVLTDVPLYHEEFFAPIVIENPVFGQYQVGVQIIGYNSNSFDATLRGDVDVSRDGSHVFLQDMRLNTPPSGLELQTVLLFSYDQRNIP
ncbi:hypothetical protein [Candidatus Protochlamydia naegleriophila]|uniref:hypothetical protein n=1 Tax=Candidatus Protochlamydia naegleriophila TaxID=389348 RepID=UPI00073FA82A|nr:hypothetical protein [Candidatus Protochlamydia naegleriophila]